MKEASKSLQRSHNQGGLRANQDDFLLLTGTYYWFAIREPVLPDVGIELQSYGCCGGDDFLEILCAGFKSCAAVVENAKLDLRRGVGLGEVCYCGE